MLLSIVIPTYNGRERLRSCLSAVFAAANAHVRAGGGEVQVIVVDDASPDGTSRWLEAHYPSVTLIRMPVNSGFAAAANAGILASSGEWVALLNDDAVPDAGWITGARLSDRGPRVAAVASLVSFQERPETVESAGDGYTVAGVAYHRTHVSDDVATGARVFSACAAAAFYRREALEDVGLFEECFEGYYEDVDLGWRLNLRGWETVFEPGARCLHKSGASYGDLSWRKVRNSARNSEIVFFSCLPGRLLLTCLPAHCAALGAQAALRVRQRRLAPFIAGKVAFIARVPYVIRRRRRIQASRRVGQDGVRALADRNWFELIVKPRLSRARHAR